MSRIGRIISAVLLVGLILAAVRLSVAFAHYWKVEREFASVQMGQSRNEVLVKLGKANYHKGSCGEIGSSDKTCATEYVYSHPFAPWLPDYYVVEFSVEDKVIQAEHLTSP